MDTKSIGVSNASLHRGSELKAKATDVNARELENQEITNRGKNFNVNLSEEAKQLLQARQQATSIAKATSPIREDRVAALKEQIANGSYKVDPEKIADGMLIEAIKDRVSSGTEV